MAKNIDIPNGWEVKKLGEIGNFLKGKGIKKDELCDNGLPCVIYGQIYTSYDFYTDKFTSFIPINLKPYTTEIYQNDILFTGSGETKEEIGKSIAYIGKEYAYAGGDIIILRQDKIISIFITYYLNSIGRKQLNRLGQGDSVVHIYKSILESVKIPVPPLAEQEKIAEILSLWDKAIGQTKELIAYKEKQKKGLMQNLLTGKKRLHGFTDEWKTVNINDCFNHFGGTALEKYIDNTGEYKFISIGNYSTDGKYIDNGNRIILNDITKIKLLNKNELVMVLNDKTSDGKIIGACILIDKDNTYIYNQRSEKLVCKQNILPIYAWFLLNSNHFRKKIFSKAQGGTQIYINFSSIIDIKIVLPPVDEQKAIADILCKADEEIELLNKQLDLYTEQKKGLMQNLLTGKVRVTV